MVVFLPGCIYAAVSIFMLVPVKKADAVPTVVPTISPTAEPTAMTFRGASDGATNCATCTSPDTGCPSYNTDCNLWTTEYSGPGACWMCNAGNSCCGGGGCPCSGVEGCTWSTSLSAVADYDGDGDSDAKSSCQKYWGLDLFAGNGLFTYHTPPTAAPTALTHAPTPAPSHAPTAGTHAPSHVPTATPTTPTTSPHDSVGPGQASDGSTDEQLAPTNPPMPAYDEEQFKRELSQTNVVDASVIFAATVSPTLSPTSHPTMEGYTSVPKSIITERVIVAPLSFPLSSSAARTPTMQNILCTGFANSLGFDAETVDIESVNAGRRLLADGSPTKITFAVQSRSAAEDQVDMLKANIVAVARSGAMVDNIKLSASKAGLLTADLKSMSKALNISVADLRTEKTEVTVFVMQVASPAVDDVASPQSDDGTVDGESHHETIAVIWISSVSTLSTLASLLCIIFCARYLLKRRKEKRHARRESEMLGISLGFVLEHFEGELQARMSQLEWRTNPYDNLAYTERSFEQYYGGASMEKWQGALPVEAPTNPTFKQIAPVVAYGHLAFGYNKRCPRDRKMHCAIVDGLHSQGRSNSADHFVSWAWEYSLSGVKKSLDHFTNIRQKQSREWQASQTYLWFCFFCNNQFRILQDSNKVEFTSMASVFEHRLKAVGNMLVIMDQLEESKYTSRLWCIFEVFVANTAGIPLTVLLPEEELRVYAQIGVYGLKELRSITAINAENAKATLLEDEEGIKTLIRRTDGFDFINRRVQQALVTELVHCLMEQPSLGAEEFAIAVEHEEANESSWRKRREAEQSHFLGLGLVEMCKQMQLQDGGDSLDNNYIDPSII